MAKSPSNNPTSTLRRPILLTILFIVTLIAFKLGSLDAWMIQAMEIMNLPPLSPEDSSLDPVWYFWTAIALLTSGLILMGLRIRALSTALKINESSFKDFFERFAMPAGLISDHHFIDINPAALSALKLRSKDRTQHLHLSDLSPESQADGESSHQKAEQNLAMAQRKGKLSFEWLHRCSDGETLHAQSNLTPLLIKGSPGFFYSFQDITEQRYCEEALKRCQEKMLSIFEDSREAILFLSADHTFFDANSSALQLFGLNGAEELSALLQLSADFQDDASDSMTAAEQHIQTGFDLGEHSFEWRFKKESGEEFLGEVRLFAFSYDGEAVLKMSVCDATQIKRAKQNEACRNQIIELIAQAAPLPDILELIAKSVHISDPAKRAAILRVDDNSQLLIPIAAPDLPDFFDASLCPFSYEAVETEQRVIIEDIRDFTHEDWPQQSTAIQAGIGAFWVDPIQSTNGKILGAFITYHQEAGIPNEADIEATTQNVNLAKLAIELNYALEELQDAALFIKTAIKRWE